MIAQMFLLVKANIKKNISMSVIFCLITMVTLFVSYTRQQLEIGFEDLYQQKKIETNSADFSAIIPKDFYTQNMNKIQEFITNNLNAIEYEAADVFYWRNTNIQCNGKETINGTWVIRNADRTEKLSNFKLVESSTEITENAIFVPYVCKTFFGYELGDKLKFTSNKQEWEYEIAGFTEDVLFGSRGMIAFELPNELFKERAKIIENKEENAVQVMLKTAGNPSEIATKFLNFIGKIGEIKFLTSSDVNYAQSIRKGNISIYIAILKVAAFVSWIVCFSVIAFHMKNTLERDLKEIGTLKAIGYSNTVITGTYVVQFSVLGIFSALSGIILSKVLFPTIISAIATDIGFVWQTLPVIYDIFKNLIGTTFLISVLTTICSINIMKLRPTEAFRNTMVKNFSGENHISIEKLPLNLDLSIIVSRMFFEPIKSLLIIALMTVTLSVAGFGVILYAELVKEEQGLRKITGAEIYSINIQVKNSEKTNLIANELLHQPQVRKVMTVLEPGAMRLLCEDQVYASLGVYSDYKALENPSIYSGRYPKHKNEVAISGKLAETLGKKIGDNIGIIQSFQETPIKKNYLITGYTQGTYTGGMDIFLTMEGLMQIDPKQKIDTIHVYLNSSTESDNFTKLILERFGDDVSYIGNFEDLFNAQFKSIINSVSNLVWIIIAVITIVIIALVIFITKITLLTRKQDFGIMKALGFSFGQLVNQVSSAFIIYIVGGGIISGIFLSICMNQIIKIMFFSMGVHKIDFHFPLLWIWVLILCIGGVSYIVASVAARGIKKIMPCEMLQKE